MPYRQQATTPIYRCPYCRDELERPLVCDDSLSCCGFSLCGAKEQVHWAFGLEEVTSFGWKASKMMSKFTALSFTETVWFSKRSAFGVSIGLTIRGLYTLAEESLCTVACSYFPELFFNPSMWTEEEILDLLVFLEGSGVEPGSHKKAEYRAAEMHDAVLAAIDDNDVEGHLNLNYRDRDDRIDYNADLICPSRKYVRELVLAKLPNILR